MVRSRRALLLTALLAVLALLITGIGAAAWAYSRIGRTPGELIDYSKRRLEGHPNLELVALPVLDAVGGWLGEPDKATRALPFIVPPLPPGVVTAAVGPPESGDPMRVLVGPTRSVTSLALAARSAPDGAVVEVDPGDYLADVAVWNQRKLTIRGMGPGVRLLAGGRSAEGKAIWVIRNGDFTVENITFAGGRVADRNGAGIRLEGGRLVVRQCLFHDNESGILTNAGEDIELDVENSEFSHNGAGDGQSHAIYVGAIGRFRLSGSYIHHANVGHLVKSRAKRNRIEYNRLTDESGGQASYELEFPNGGVAEVVGNIVQQGSGTRNSVMLSYGVEGYGWPVNRLAMAHNTLVNDRRYGGTFVRVAPGAQAVWTRNNLWVGPGRLNLPDAADSAGDRRAEWPAFVQPSREDYRLTEAARAAMAGIAPVPPALAPRYEYQHPLRLRPVPDAALLPGALHSPPR